MVSKRPASTEAQWRKFGTTDPYYGVLSEARFRRGNLDPVSLEEFFETGRKHVDWLLNQTFQMFGCAPCSVLDFGCGAGRLSLAFATKVDRVVGVDVSEGMLSEVRKNAERNHLTNVDAVLRLEDAAGDYDLVHSFIVFQHIPAMLGYEILTDLLRRVTPGGVIAIQLTTSPATRRAGIYFGLTRRMPVVGRVWNILKGRPWGYPIMQMHCYEPSKVARMFESCGFNDVRIVAHADNTVTGYNSLWYFGRLWL